MGIKMILHQTYYILAEESRYSGPRDTPVYATNGSILARVPRAFFASMCIQGSGKLADGRVLNFTSSCGYGDACLTSGPTCYRFLNSQTHPWGQGWRGTPLRPLRSIAVDPRTIPLGSYVYMPRWHGLQIPSIDGLGGYTHDGCFRAEDTGGAIDDNHIDIFAGTEGMHRALERIFPTHTNFDASVRTTSCETAVSAGMSVGTKMILGVAAGAGAGWLGWKEWNRRGMKRRRR
jgi:3D (Asp-Asp-Asp) domain-containing protein